MVLTKPGHDISAIAPASANNFGHVPYYANEAHSSMTGAPVATAKPKGSLDSPSKYASEVNSIIDALSGSRDYNNAWSAEQASIQRDWSAEQAQIVREFNSSEAAKNRRWQEYMSNTAHQREIKDLMAAGLNPILSAMGGNGAAVTSGASASASVPSGSTGGTDESMSSAIASILATVLSNQYRLQEFQLNAELQSKLLDRQLATNEYLTLMGFDVNREIAKTQAAASMANASTSAYASMYGADKSYELGWNSAWLKHEEFGSQQSWQTQQNALDRLHDETMENKKYVHSLNLQNDEQEFLHDEAMLHPKNAYDAAFIAGATAAELLNAIDVPVNNSTKQAANRYAMSDHTADDWTLFLNSINY